MLGFVLAIGLVVDDAIVVLENIHRRVENGEPPLLAAFQGSRSAVVTPPHSAQPTRKFRSRSAFPTSTGASPKPRTRPSLNGRSGGVWLARMCSICSR